jgi:Zn-dependent protease
MLTLLFNGQVGLFVIIMITIIFSLSLHEFGHAAAAKLLGDDTAQRMGRLNINPVSHIDPMGLLMVVIIGFGFAKPVPFDVRNIKVAWGSAAVALAGPAMNFILAVLSVNILFYGIDSGSVLVGSGAFELLQTMALINLLLMLFNLIPLGALDGHYIMSWLLPRHLSYKYDQLNAQYGNMLFLGLIVLSFMGLPIFSFLMGFAGSIVPFITFV